MFRKSSYTVILLYPEIIATHYGDTYTTVVYAENRNRAAAVARDRVIEDYKMSCKNSIEILREDFSVIAIFEGNLLGFNSLMQQYKT